MSEIKVKVTSFYFSPKVTTLQRTNTENSKQIFPGKELRSHSPNFKIGVFFVSDLYIPTIDLSILLQEKSRPILGIHKSLTDT